MKIKIALAGNPNSGKTTLFNALTGSNQFVGNWPGVTVEKKEGKLKSDKEVTITDLPGIYSLSPYTLEEVVARNYLLEESPDAILNIVDGTNLERNLYLTTQLLEMGIPVVVAINMMDVVKKRGDKINIEMLSQSLGCRVVEISALKGTGIEEAARATIKAAGDGAAVPPHKYSGCVEHTLAHIEEAVLHSMPEEKQRWYAIKIFESDEKVLEKMALPKEVIEHIQSDIEAAESEMDDDAESIITNERYIFIGSIIGSCYRKKSTGGLSASDKIDRVVTNRFLALPIFAIIMFIVYYISITSVGAIMTDFTNDQLFGDGWYLGGAGRANYEEAVDKWADDNLFTSSLESEVKAAEQAGVIGASDIMDAVKDKDFGDFSEAYGTYGESLAQEGYNLEGVLPLDEDGEFAGVPSNEDYGIWIPSLPDLATSGLEKLHCASWLQGLIVNGIIAGVGAVLGFVPQIFVLFIMLAFLEACGYMSRIAFIMDRIFRKFGLSGKSFIPMLIGTGCGVPGVMASRTIENDRDRRMTIMTTTFIPCGAKMPIIALIASALFGGEWWVAPSAYFVGVGAIIVSGIILKKTRAFAGNPAPFVMELPAYHLPTAGTVLRSMWERGWSFIKKAGTLILAASVIIWAGSVFGMEGGHMVFNPDMELESSILGYIGNGIKWIFTPLGFGNIKATIATIMGLVAKEEVVGVFGVLDFEGLSKTAGYSFLVFNLLCAPCFAAIGAIKREMNNSKWTWFAIGYQCTFAYAISLMIYQFSSIFTGLANPVGICASVVVLAGLCYMLFRKNKYNTESLM